MSKKINVAGYAKLAKLWDDRRDEALLYHQKYYVDKYKGSNKYELAGVYVDITGNREIAKRPEMLRLLYECRCGKVECIAVQTKGYLAADTREFCYLFKMLRGFGNGVDVVTEDKYYHIDTIRNEENQLQELAKMAEKYISLNPDDFREWRTAIMRAIR